MMPVSTERKTSAAPSADDLIAMHHDDVWRFLVALGAQPAEADDLTQDTFVELLRGGFEYRSHAETAAWLHRAAKHRFIGAIRKLKRRALVPMLDEAEADWASFQAECDPDVRLELLDRCLRELEGRDRDALDMRYRLEHPREQMAEELGLSTHGVRALLERLRRRLRECVERRLSHGD
jgi:RNA polymerase sigma-70 factor, ECF subfamily